MGQAGSHVELRRVTKGGGRQTLVIPDHKELRKGTLRAVYQQALRYLPEDVLKMVFYK